MEYFMTHIIYILIAALVIAGLASVWAFGSAYNAKHRAPEMQEKQDMACESCALASMCTRFGIEEDGCKDDIMEYTPSREELDSQYQKIDWEFQMGKDKRN